MLARSDTGAGQPCEGEWWADRDEGDGWFVNRDATSTADDQHHSRFITYTGGSPSSAGGIGGFLPMSTLTSHIPGMAEAMESVSDKLKVRCAAHVAVMLGGRF